MFKNHRETKVYLNWLEASYEPDRARVVQFHSKSWVRKALTETRIFRSRGKFLGPAKKREFSDFVSTKIVYTTQLAEYIPYSRQKKSMATG